MDKINEIISIWGAAIITSEREIKKGEILQKQ